MLSAVLAAVAVLSAHAQPAAEPAPAEVAEAWSAELPRVFRELRAEPEAAFVQAWGEAYDRYNAALNAALRAHDISHGDAERLRHRLLYEWARGRAAWPEQHAQATGDPDFEESARYWDFVDVLELDRPDLLALPEYAAFMVGRLHARRDALVDVGRIALDPEAVRLTAELAEAERADDAEIACFYVRHAVEEHIGDHGADGWPATADRALDRCPGEATDTLRADLAEARADREGHLIEIYKRVGPVALEAHVFPAEAEGAPAMVWFHGGGWYQGSWSWCGVCEVFKEAGYTVVQVEYRLGARHATGIAEAVADAGDAVAWVRANADEFDIDPARIYAGGFSAGGHLALTTGLLTAPGSPERPDAVVGFSACADLTDAYWTLERAGRSMAAGLSPVNADMAGAPPVMMVQARDDRLCRHDAAETLIGALHAAGRTAELVSFDDGGHFGLYRDDTAYETARSRALSFLSE